MPRKNFRLHLLTPLRKHPHIRDLFIDWMAYAQQESKETQYV